MEENILEIEIDDAPIEVNLTIYEGKVSLILDELNNQALELDEISVENENIVIIEEDDDIIEEEIEIVSGEDDSEIWEEDEIADLDDFSEDFLDDIDLLD